MVELERVRTDVTLALEQEKQRRLALQAASEVLAAQLCRSPSPIDFGVPTSPLNETGEALETWLVVIWVEIAVATSRIIAKCVFAEDAAATVTTNFR